MKTISSKQQIVPQVPLLTWPSAGQGVRLYPRPKNGFTIRFGAELTANSKITEAEATRQLCNLTRQVEGVKFPVQQLHTTMSYTPVAANFKCISTDGIFSFTFQDDITNHVQEALDFLCGTDCDNLKVLIVTHDGSGNDIVLDAWFAKNLTIETIEHSALDYSLSEPAQKVLTVSSSQVQRAFWIHGPQQPAIKVDDLAKQLF